MPQHLEPIETQLGIVRGRDGFYLDEVHFEYGKREVRFSGDVNGNLCSRNVHNQDWIEYSLVFSGVLEFGMTDVDFAADDDAMPSESKANQLASGDAGLVSDEMNGHISFVKVIDSEKLNRMRVVDSADKVTRAHEHYIFYTYDDVFEIISSSYKLTVKTPEP
jgi:hypothetical protein